MLALRNMLSATLGVINAAIVFMLAFDLVDWTDAQVGLVLAAANAVGLLVVFAVAHFQPGTKKEPVGLQGSFAAALLSMIALGNGFAWWNVTEAQGNALIALVSVVVVAIGVLMARGNVTANSTPPLD